MSQGELRGRVLRATAGFADVATDRGVLRCRLRGRLKKEALSTDLIVVGDFVTVSPVEEGVGRIESIEPRRTVFSRRHPGRGGRHREDVLIANLDLLVCVFAVSFPIMKPRLLDRFLVIAESQGIVPIVVLNKIDEEGAEEVRELLEPHRAIGYEIFETSTVTGEGIDALRERMRGQVSALVGPSGVGKSSLVNAIEPGLDLRVGETREVDGKGRHTTRVASLHPLTGGGYIADTPGIRELAAFEIPDEELPKCFPEFRPLLGGCAFRNCTHLNEPDCAIVAAVDEGVIDEDRYESYAKMRLDEERPERFGH
ncbi:MAG TPA: ribosome small subunit-dependent GTPase A [Planctomycetota bacterium]|nr:ribosome small subunit-dependent GTPase A [Myxococcales bacterium]HLU47965.1 ribosome small subunit-dependent GTPase A [Planctomycetota bacterium]